MPPKIAFITNFCPHYVIRPFELLSKRHDVDFYFTGGGERYWDKKNKMWQGQFKGHYLNGFFLLPKFRITPGVFCLLWRRYDIILKTIDDRFALPLVFLIAKIRRKPFIFWTGHWSHPETSFHKISLFFTWFIYTHSDAIVVYGEHIRRYLMDFGVDHKKIFTAAHAIDNGLFNQYVSDEKKQCTRDELKLRGEKIILYVGRLEDAKGLNYLIEAAGKIKDKNFVMVFIGTGSKRDDFEKAMKEKGMKALFLGHIANTELFPYYAAADVFVLPSITTKDFKEPWGLVVNEAMNQGCPVITTNAVGAAAGGLVEDGKTGFIVDEKSAESLKKALEIILQDDSLRVRMRQAANEKIKAWTQERMVEGFMEAIDFVLVKH